MCNSGMSVILLNLHDDDDDDDDNDDDDACLLYLVTYNSSMFNIP